MANLIKSELYQISYLVKSKPYQILVVSISFFYGYSVLETQQSVKTKASNNFVVKRKKNKLQPCVLLSVSWHSSPITASHLPGNAVDGTSIFLESHLEFSFATFWDCPLFRLLQLFITIAFALWPCVASEVSPFGLCQSGSHFLFYGHEGWQLLLSEERGHFY